MTNEPKLLQHREDRKIQKLVERIERKQALQAKAINPQDQPPPSKSE
jgi:hypothetical protein